MFGPNPQSGLDLRTTPTTGYGLSRILGGKLKCVTQEAPFVELSDAGLCIACKNQDQLNNLQAFLQFYELAFNPSSSIPERAKEYGYSQGLNLDFKDLRNLMILAFDSYYLNNLQQLHKATYEAGKISFSNLALAVQDHLLQTNSGLIADSSKKTILEPYQPDAEVKGEIISRSEYRISETNFNIAENPLNSQEALVTIELTAKAIESLNGRELIFVIDCSGSMEPAFPHLQKALTEVLTKYVNNEDRLHLIYFGGEHQSHENFSRADALASVNSIPMLGQTNFRGPLKTAFNLANKATDPQAVSIIIMTDGQAGDSGPSKDAFLRLLIEQYRDVFPVGGPRMISLGFTDEIDATLLTGLAEETDGVFMEARTAEQLQECYVALMGAAVLRTSAGEIGLRVGNQASYQPFHGMEINGSKNIQFVLPKEVLRSQAIELIAKGRLQSEFNAISKVSQTLVEDSALCRQATANEAYWASQTALTSIIKNTKLNDAAKIKQFERLKLQLSGNPSYLAAAEIQTQLKQINELIEEHRSSGHARVQRNITNNANWSQGNYQGVARHNIQAVQGATQGSGYRSSSIFAAPASSRSQQYGSSQYGSKKSP